MPRSLVGNVLVASTLIHEPLFARGVCLVVHHDDDGAIGVMLNRPIWPPSAELMKMLAGDSEPSTPKALPGGPQTAAESESVSDSDDRPARLEMTLSNPSGDPQTPAVSPIHYGGPLSGPIVALHNTTSLAEAQAGNGIYVAAQKKHLEQLVRSHPGHFRLIVGHAGWSGEQLQQEVEAGYWHVLPASPEMIFGVDSDLWPLLIRRATGSSLSRWVGAPDNPVAWALN